RPPPSIPFAIRGLAIKQGTLQQSEVFFICHHPSGICGGLSSQLDRATFVARRRPASLSESRDQTARSQYFMWPSQASDRGTISVASSSTTGDIIPTCQDLSNTPHHRQQKPERGTSGAFCCPCACDC